MVKDECEGYGEVEETESFGTERERQDLDCVGDDERAKREGVRRRKEKDERNDGVSRCDRAVLGVFCETYCLCHVEEHHQAGRGEEEESTPETVDGVRGVQSQDKTPDLDHAVDKKLSASIGDADLVQDFGEVVREETVAGPLGKEGDGDDDVHAFTIAWGREERFPTDIGGNGLIELEGSLDFVEFKLHHRILSATT